MYMVDRTFTTQVEVNYCFSYICNCMTVMLLNIYLLLILYFSCYHFMMMIEIIYTSIHNGSSRINNCLTINGLQYFFSC